MSLKFVQKHILLDFWGFLDLLHDIKIDLINLEPHHVKFLLYQTSFIVELIGLGNCQKNIVMILNWSVWFIIRICSFLNMDHSRT